MRWAIEKGDGGHRSRGKNRQSRADDFRETKGFVGIGAAFPFLRPAGLKKKE